ncbi:MAG: TasA family protein [Dehalococcoidales bacterium]|jgi:predicted ribosomally synthesized peptide with SipW-like signal peptide
MKKILIIAMACVLTVGLIGGAFAYFTDTETASSNTFTAGYMNLGINDANNPSGIITLTNMAPGHSYGDYVINFKNFGSLDGKLSYVVNIVGEPAEPNTLAPDNTGTNVDAATFATQVFITKLLWNGDNILPDMGTIAGSDGKLSLYELANAGSLTDPSETLNVGETDTVTYEFTLNPDASDEYQGDGVIMSIVATLTSN